MIWYDMIWCDMIRYDMIWYDMIWYDMTWRDMISYHIISYDMTWYLIISYHITWHDITWHDILSYHISYEITRFDWYDIDRQTNHQCHPTRYILTRRSTSRSQPPPSRWPSCSACTGPPPATCTPGFGWKGAILPYPIQHCSQPAAADAYPALQHECCCPRRPTMVSRSWKEWTQSAQSEASCAKRRPCRVMVIYDSPTAHQEESMIWY